MTKKTLISISVILLLAMMAALSIRAAGVSPDSPHITVQSEKISVSGTVVDGKGQPVVGAKITLEDENGKILIVRSGAKGGFVLEGLTEKAIYIMYVSHGSTDYPTEARSFLRNDEITIRP